MSGILYFNLINECENIRKNKNVDYGNIWVTYHEQTILDVAYAKLHGIMHKVNHTDKENLNDKHISDLFDIANYALYGAYKTNIDN